ncbi:MAG: two-component regulator propeller domain-containing protein, partial [Flammeovirgaceae bacterium]
MIEVKQQRLRWNGYINPLPLPIKGVFLIATILFCCESCSREKREFSGSIKQDTLVAPYITWLANLPDSAKPRVVFLKNVPKPVSFTPPRRMNVPTHAQTNKSLGQGKELRYPVSRNNQLNGKANFTNFSSDDGLASDNVYCGFKDKSGTLWFGTGGNGVSRYDGQSFTTFSNVIGLNSLSVTHIEEDKNGDLWFVAYESVIRYDGRMFAPFVLPQLFSKYQVNVVKSDSKGNLWFGTN